jgi:hypothetical protein
MELCPFALPLLVADGTCNSCLSGLRPEDLGRKGVGDDGREERNCNHKSQLSHNLKSIQDFFQEKLTDEAADNNACNEANTTSS